MGLKVGVAIRSKSWGLKFRVLVGSGFRAWG